MIILKVGAAEFDWVEHLLLWARLARWWVVIDTKFITLLYHVNNFTPTGEAGLSPMSVWHL